MTPPSSSIHYKSTRTVHASLFITVPDSRIGTSHANTTFVEMRDGRRTRALISQRVIDLVMRAVTGEAGCVPDVRRMAWETFVLNWTEVGGSWLTHTFTLTCIVMLSWSTR